MLETVFECGAVCWEGKLSVERWVTADICVWSGVLGPIYECESVCWDR